MTKKFEDELQSDRMEDNTCYVVVQFVGEAMDLISQYGSDSSISYTVHNIVGRPTKFPSYGNFSQTFDERLDYGPWWRDCPSGQVFRSLFLSSAWSLQSRRYLP